MRRALLTLLCIGVGACTDGARVEVGGERLHGERLAEPGVIVFRGVPFAEPPVGELRWRAPQPLTKRQAERDATRFAPACMQSLRILEWYRDLAEIFGASRDVMADLDISEDCLYLNVWTPSLDEGAGLPVMVYVHGGSNRSGWSFEPNYHGHVLANRGVVVVTVAYRVGAFGFLSHPDFDDGQGVANFGLLDLIAALEWIRTNIPAFGGDPGRITLFGESAGAENILALMASPGAAGLYHRAILQSTAGFGIPGRPTLVDEQARGVSLTEALGAGRSDPVQALRDVPAQELLERYEQQFAEHYHSPAVDGQVLQRSVWQAAEDGELAQIPVIIGTNADEWHTYIADGVDHADLVATVEASRHLAVPQALAEVEDETDARRAMDRIQTADHMLCPSQAIAARLDNAWMYYFSRIRDGDGGAAVRAYHGAELPYVFGTHDPWMTTSDTDGRLSGQMMSYWVRFARSGDPNSDELPDWPEFRSPGYKVLEFSDRPNPIDAPEPVLCRIFRESFDSR